MLRWGVLVFVVVWVAQLAAIAVRLDEPTWTKYWEMRGFYRPGLIAFRNVAEPWLPGDYFAWHSKRGATAGFVFATGLYALPAIPVGMLVSWRYR